MVSERSSTTSRLVIGGVVLVVALLLGAGFIGCGKPPQMGAHAEVFHTIDALFTAVTARDEKLLGQCERRLHDYKDTAKLPAEASNYLDGIIKKARDGRWESAAEKLYGFMKAQRREGAENQHIDKKAKRGPQPGKR